MAEEPSLRGQSIGVVEPNRTEYLRCRGSDETRDRWKLNIGPKL